MPRQSTLTPLLLSNASATGGTFYFNGGKALFCVVAGNGGATISLQILGPDNTTWLTVNGTAITVNSAVFLELPEGSYRAAVTGGTAPNSIHATLKGFV